MAGVDLSPPLRRLAALSDFRLGLVYTAGVFPSVLLRGWAETDTSLAWLNLPAALLALIAVSALISVIAFYRDDDFLLAGALLAVITGLGTGVALVATAAIVTGSIGAALVLGGLVRPGHAPNPSSPALSWSRLGGQEISSVPGSRYDG
jgi:tetrahydromethanopterin S-methyltransferase subunit D